MKSIDDLSAVTEEDATVDFKAGFDPASKREWCELTKDIVAMANSGGGVILFGVTDDGEPAMDDLAAVRALDPAQVTDKIYTPHWASICGLQPDQGPPLE